MSTVSNVSSLSAVVPPTKVPAEFAHPALQELVRIGKTHGSVDSEQLRVALVQAEISPKRMKVVLRSLDHQGIHVTLDAATAHRAVAATPSRATATATARKKTATKKPKAAAKPVAKTVETVAAKKTAAKKAAAKPATEPDGAKASTSKTAKTVHSRTTKAAAAAEPEVEAPKARTRKAAAKTTAAKRTAASKDGEIDADNPVAVGAVKGTDVKTDSNGGKVKAGEEESEAAGFVIRDDDEDDAPAQQVVTAGATADPVKDYLKQIGKVALLNAGQPCRSA